jgi:hypothetical protein
MLGKPYDFANVPSPTLFRVQAPGCNSQSQAGAKPFYSSSSSNTSITSVTSDLLPGQRGAGEFVLHPAPSMRTP